MDQTQNDEALDIIRQLVSTIRFSMPKTSAAMNAYWKAVKFLDKTEGPDFRNDLKAGRYRPESHESTIREFNKTLEAVAQERIKEIIDRDGKTFYILGVPVRENPDLKDGEFYFVSTPIVGHGFPIHFNIYPEPGDYNGLIYPLPNGSDHK